MKKHLILMALAVSVFAVSTSAQTDSTGFAGDNFSLEGAIELFKKAASPEDFEKLLNAEDSDVNNLDLNDDGETDYLRVVDNSEGDSHALVVQAVLSETESQDVAVLEIEKQGKEDALLQIVGDEAVFGKETIVEPFDDEVKKTGRGPSVSTRPTRIVVNVWGWPSVRFVYAPSYRLWVSPVRWRAYPVWWRPFHPRPFGVFRVRVAPFHRHCAVVTTHRVVHAHAVYAPHRVHSKTVVHREKTTRVSVHKGKNGGVKATKTTRTKTTRVRRGGRH